jgi:hypothetical protein
MDALGGSRRILFLASLLCFGEPRGPLVLTRFGLTRDKAKGARGTRCAAKRLPSMTSHPTSNREPKTQNLER